MARNFNNTSSDRLVLGDIFAFDKDVAWSVAAFCRFEELTVDERAIVSKMNSVSGTLEQFELLATKESPPTFRVYSGSFVTVITGATTVTTGTWYLVGVVSTGGGTTDDLELFALTMDGTVIEDSVKGTPEATASSNTADVEIGCRADGGDTMDGDLAHVVCVSTQWGLQDFKDYLRAPARKVAREAANAVFYHPIIGDSPEPDFSANTNTGTVTGTTVSNGPPIGPLFGYAGYHGLTVSGAPPGARPQGPLGHPLHGPFAGPVA